MLKIGLTGGIGSGKTAVSDLFGKLGAAVIDTDRIARDLVNNNPVILNRLITTFGPDIIDEQGRLNRKQLGKLVFNDPRQRKKLEALLHPEIRKEVVKRLEQLSREARTAYVIIVVPLLLETDFRTLVDRVLVVLADSEKRISRIQARDGRSLDEIRSIIASQASDDQRRNAADDIIENNSNINDLEKQVEKLHERYLGLSASDS